LLTRRDTSSVVHNPRRRLRRPGSAVCKESGYVLESLGTSVTILMTLRKSFVSPRLCGEIPPGASAPTAARQLLLPNFAFLPSVRIFALPNRRRAIPGRFFWSFSPP